MLPGATRAARCSPLGGTPQLELARCVVSSAPASSAPHNECTLTELRFLERSPDIRLAYHRTPGRSPGVVFIHGFMSDMTGTKATAVEALCRERGQAFLRFDCRGHGRSSEAFEAGTIGKWAEDAIAVLDALTAGPQVLVGSSMGGWLMVLTALARPERIAGMVGIAAAPDFVQDLWAALPAEARREIEAGRPFRTPSAYRPEPYCITPALIADGFERLVLERPIPFAGPVRLLHGMRDADVPWRKSLALAEALTTPDVELHLIKDGEHRLSREQDLERLCQVVAGVCDRLERSGG